MSESDTSMHSKAAESDPIAYYLREIWRAVDGNPAHLAHLTVTGSGSLPSVFPVTELAAAAVGAAGLALAQLREAVSGALPPVSVDRRLASLWFGTSLRPQGWQVAPQWDAVAGDYRAADGWIRLHTNAPHHRAAALAVLGVPAEREAVARAVSGWQATALETAIVEQRGCAAAMRSLGQWAEHPQGRAVAQEPLLFKTPAEPVAMPNWAVPAERPLQGIRVLDLTRILAGPVATRFLAGYGADVLRIDPRHWDEPNTAPEVVLGKRCARLDLKQPADLEILERLLGQADVLVHGYRPEALARLGLDPERRRRINPGLVDVSLDAYGWSGPWQGRRGFDSLLQMSSGIADAGMRETGREVPAPLPLQALDQAVGYLLATAALRGLTRRLTTGAGCAMRTSLARMAQLLVSGGLVQGATEPLAPETEEDQAANLESTGWGPARRLKPPVAVAGTPMAWDYPASQLGSSRAAW